MEDMIKDIVKKINNKDYIQECEKVKEFGGADVIVCQKAPYANTSKIIVETKYSKEISWLIEQLKNVYSGEYDYISKYDFFAKIANSAIEYITNNGDKDVEKMMRSIVEEITK